MDVVHEYCHLIIHLMSFVTCPWLFNFARCSVHCWAFFEDKNEKFVDSVYVYMICKSL